MLNTFYCLFVEFITNIISFGFVAVFIALFIFGIAWLIEIHHIGKELKEEGNVNEQADN